MRVIGGIAKGRRLRAADVKEMRPTTDRVRQALFDMLQGRIEDARVLDLFAGSGSLGIEALSRGAQGAVFVDSSREACDVILQNLNVTGLRGQAKIRRADVVRRLSRAPGDAPFDLVFVDPPYDRGLGFVVRVLEKLVGGGWLTPGATVVVESAQGELEWPAPLREIKSRRFGRTEVRVAVYEDAERGADRDLPGDL